MQAVITNDIVINELVTAADIIIMAYGNYKMSHIFFVSFVWVEQRVKQEKQGYKSDASLNKG